MKSKRTFIANLAFVLFCLTGSALCLFLFWRDLNATLDRIGEQPVGIIEFRYNTAQRRFVDRVLWDRLRNESPVFDGDFIRTADLSEATITFARGDTVDMSANTMIQFLTGTRGGDARMNLGEGGLNINTHSASGMVIYAGDNRLSVAPGTTLRASSLEGGVLDIAVSQGAVAVETAAGAHSIGAGLGLVLSAAGEVLAVPQAVAISPPPGARFLSQEAGDFPVNFNWNNINYPPGAMTRLEIASDRSFNRIFFTETTASNDIDLSLPEGVWFWRLNPIISEPQGLGFAENFPEVPYSRLTIAHSPPPTLISPANGHLFSFRSRPPAVRFQWSSSASASFYLLEVADNPLLQNPVLRIQASANEGEQSSVVSSDLWVGSWYWRVTPAYSRSFTSGASAAGETDDWQPSATRHFVIGRGATLIAPAPVAPSENARVNIGRDRQDIIFSWRRESEAVSYTVRVSANRDMSSPIIEQTVAQAFFRYGREETALTEGTWFWTVQQTGSDGYVSPASQPRVFSTSPDDIIQRQIFPPDDFVVTESLLPNTHFTWRTNLDDTRFQVAQDAEFSMLVIDERSPAGTHTVRSLPSGVYYWRITNAVEAQRLESPPRRFEVAGPLLPPVLGLPTSAFPTSQAGNVVISASLPVVNFTWEPVPGAGYHVFVLSMAGAAQNPILETTIPGSALSVNMGGFQDGEYVWSVHGLAREHTGGARRTSPAAAQAMNMRHLRPVVLEHPRDGWAFPGAAAAHNPGALRWSSQGIPSNVVFTLSRNAQMTNIVLRQTGIPHQHTLPRLPAGDYFWTIQAQDADGLDISSAAPAHFRVLPMQPLPAPQNRMPAGNHTITHAQIIADRSVVFSWDAVDGANAYVLTVFREAGAARAPVVQTPMLRTTSYTVQDIRLLGRGSFSWSVESLHVLDDGFIEQHGDLQENRLFVDIPHPQQIRVIDAGTLYGR